MPSPRSLTVLPWVALIAAAVVLVGLTVPALHGPLVLDSVKLHALEPLVAEHGQRAIWHTPAFGGGLNRVLSMGSFVLNVQATGELSVFSIKLTNVVLHVAVSLLVFVFTRRVVRATPHAGLATRVGLATGVLWLLSPLNTNVTLYAIQRMAQLSALFTVLGLVFYLAGRMHTKPGVGRGLVALSLFVCLPLAVLSKQNGILLLGFVWLLEWYVLRATPRGIRARTLVAVGVMGAGLALATVLWLYPGTLNYEKRDFTLVERLLSQPRALWSYVQHSLLPYGGDAGIYTDGFRVSTSAVSPLSTLWAMLAGLAVLLFCVTAHRGRSALVAFGLAFFLVGHAVESTFIALEPYFLHRNYLPNVGLYFALAFAGAAWLPGRRWFWVLLVIYGAYFAALDYARALTWHSRAGIVSAGVTHHPDSPRALTDYAQMALARGEYRQALAANQRALELTGGLPHRIQRLYILCHAGAPLPDAEYRALRSVRVFGVNREIAQALDNLLRLHERGQCPALHATALVEALDALAVRYAAQGGDPWTLTYYADTWLYRAGFQEAVHRRLAKRMVSGHLASGLYRLDLLRREGREQEAAAWAQRIRDQFRASRLKPFEGMLTAP